MILVNRDINVNAIIELYKNNGATDVKCTKGTRGLHIDFKTPIDDVWQYTFIKFTQ